MRRGILGLLFSLFAGIGHAQKIQASNIHGRITGKVIDSSSAEPLEYATISLFLGGDKKPVNGSTTNISGQFTVKDVSEGMYRIIIEFIGYEPYTLDTVVISTQNVSLDIKTVALVKKPALLQAVTLTMPGKIIENRIDKLVFNAEQDLTSQGGVATDILKKVPLVSVDIDGKVELAGSSSIRFLIDGKPSSAFGSNITDVLQSLPASQIKSIEVVTNPGAKYDAQGLGGIINIILKKNTAKGINGNISITAGTLLQNGSFNFNARDANFGMTAFISGNTRLTANTATAYERVSKNEPDTTTDLLKQAGTSRFNRHGVESGLGFDWTYKKKNSFSGSVNYNNFGSSGKGMINQNQVTFDGNGDIIADLAALNKNGNSFKLHSIDASINYKRTFEKEDRELEVSVNGSFANYYAKANNNQFLMPLDSLTYGSDNLNPGRQNETEISIDYNEPLAKTIILGAGGKISMSDINSVSNVFSLQNASAFLFDSSLSNNLEYHQKVYALYAELSFPVGKVFDAKIGGRYERTEINSFYSNAQQQMNSSGYNTLVPSIFFFKKIGEKQTIKLSYSKRIERPDYGDLNPFVNTSDPKNITSGNPFLKPEIGNRFELSYTRDMGAIGSFVITAFYRANNHDIQPYIIYYPVLKVGDSTYTNVAVSTRQNIGLEKNMGLSLFGNINFTKKLSIRTNIFVFHRHTINALDPGYNSNSFNYRFNVNVSYQLAKSLSR